MSTRHIISNEMEQLVERQLRCWEIGRHQHYETAETAGAVRPFVTISNAVGAGGREIADALATRLGWPVFDRNLLNAMAGNDEWRARIYQSLDERDMGWIEQTMRFLLDQRFVRNDYFRILARTVLSLARESSAIFLGRFADLLLPRHVGLRVKIMAPADLCVANFARRMGTDLHDAERSVQRIEQEREAFVAQHFPGMGGDRRRFDLLINSEHFVTGEAVDLIFKAMECRSRSVSVLQTA